MSSSVRRAPPVALIGLPLYEQEEYLPEALASLLSQTRTDFELFVVDDSAGESPGAIIRALAAGDNRVHYERNPRRLGMVENWRRAFSVATAAHPRTRYFAWASDHDVWHPRWLESLVRALECHPERVAAYPRNVRTSPNGTVIRKPWTYSTDSADGPLERVRSASRGMSAGDMVYGLFNVDALRRAGVFRSVPLPDRLLLTEVALLGELVQVDEILWHRRMLSPPFSVERQRASLFAGRMPRHSRLPWPVQHAAILVWNLVAKAALAPEVTRATGLRVTADVFAATSKSAARSSIRKRRAASARSVRRR